MTDGRFFSQLYCQEMQKAWKHHGNGEIRPGRHPGKSESHSPNFMRTMVILAVFSQESVIKEIKQNRATEGAATSIPLAF